MNPLWKSASEAVSPDHGVVMGVVTVLFMVLFAAWTWWAYAPGRREAMEQYGAMPLEDGSES